MLTHSPDLEVLRVLNIIFCLNSNVFHFLHPHKSNLIEFLSQQMTAGLSGALYVPVSQVVFTCVGSIDMDNRFTESAIAAINARLFFKLFAKDTNYTDLSVITDSSESEYWKRASSFLYLEL